MMVVIFCQHLFNFVPVFFSGDRWLNSSPSVQTEIVQQTVEAGAERCD